MRYITHSEQETRALAAVLADRLKDGSVICLNGQMGTGKTAFTRGLMEKLGCADDVASPTFAICREYRGKLRVLHFDLYRISDEDELFATGFFDSLDSGACCVIEWSAVADRFLPEDTIYIDFEYGAGENDRVISVRNGEI